ncbi:MULTISPECIES: ribosomal-processing cysteine protease Prp [Caproicibacterium]|uniref:Ribosomal processing cysteine protease Prp n=1 Tax=Caproicibacterium argilliputei TaxID=3030016 RepID=A0AA97DD90_9FIRM|nr:ribosomal-processing cysteine protease Prp [Caproicibacterium argilliputei]WOC33321.1 ribosomal-processing cysteine protease Prp [Caproicibacterium argilliputei]
MIQCRFLSDSTTGQCVGFAFSGHAGSREAGRNVVCAAVSSAAYLTANALTDVLHSKAEITEQDGVLHLRVPPADEPKCRPFLQALKLHIENLEEQYPKYINMSDKEV